MVAMLCGLACAAVGKEFQTAANPLSSPATKQVLAYLQTLAARSDHKLVSGQFTEFGTNVGRWQLDKIEAKTGSRPALFGADYSDWHTGEIRCEQANTAAIAHWRQGGLVTLNVHFFNPLRTNTSLSGLRDKGVDVAPLLDEHSPQHAVWLREMDAIADGLAQLQQAGVVVLWRPFHEMNGHWFWWGGQKTNVFIPLWRQMYDHFTHDRKLNNLLWVYSPNQGGLAGAYYPGDHYVDVVGLDAYTDNVDPKNIAGYEPLQALPKPFAFTEFGPHGPTHPPGNYKYPRFLAGLKQHFPDTVYFMAWSANWGMHTNQNVAAMLHDPWVVNLDGLPPFGRRGQK